MSNSENCYKKSFLLKPLECSINIKLGFFWSCDNSTSKQRDKGALAYMPSLMDDSKADIWVVIKKFSVSHVTLTSKFQSASALVKTVRKKRLKDSSKSEKLESSTTHPDKHIEVGSNWIKCPLLSSCFFARSFLVEFKICLYYFDLFLLVYHVICCLCDCLVKKIRPWF